MDAQKWNERYAEAGYAYGSAPNEFFKSQLELLPTGKILLPADGEGRNGIYAAQLGWEVTSFDISIEGRKKAMQLANDQGVEIDYLVGDFRTFDLKPKYYDVLALVYAHFPAQDKSVFHRKLSTYLKPGGTVIFEGFSKSHLALVQENPSVGGPRNISMLFSLEEMKTEFTNFNFHYLKEETIDLHEGKYHNGLGAVIRMVAKKK